MKRHDISPRCQADSKSGTRQSCAADHRHIAWIPGLLLMLTVALPGSAAEPDKFDFKVLAQLDPSTLGTIKNSANLALSFNDKGQAAFVVSLLPSGEGIFVADGSTMRNVTPSYSTYTFSTRLQINNRGTIVSRMSKSVNVTINTWDSASPDRRGIVDMSTNRPACICSGGNRAGQICFGSKADCPELQPDGSYIYWDCRCVNAYASFMNPSLNNIGQVAYLGTPQGTQGTNQLVSTGPLGDAMAGLSAPNHTVPWLICGVSRGRWLRDGSHPCGKKRRKDGAPKM